MNWYTGNISQAVKLSQQKNSIFVVYVEGKDELSQKMGKFINEDTVIKNHLESDNFVAIRIETESEAYMQFAQIYQLVPSPSLFFIGKNGAPLEVATGIIESAQDLIKKIERVLQISKKSSNFESSALISEEQASSSSTAIIEKSLPSDNHHQEKPSPTIDNTNVESQPIDHAAVPESQPIDHAAQLEKARKIIESKRKEKEAEEEKLQREKEMERRKLGKTLQSFKEKQMEEEFQKLKEERIRDRLEEQVARQRILEKIASDKAERAQRFSSKLNTVEPTKSQENLIPKQQPSNSDKSRIQFRTPDGEIHTNIFNIKDEFNVIRNHVANTILNGNTNFQLATTFPKREFTTADESQTILELGLYPSALILIFCNAKSIINSSSVVPQSGNFFAMLNSLFLSLCSPIFAIYDYLRSFISRRDNTNNNETNPEPKFGGGVSDTIKGYFTGNVTGGIGAQKRASEDQSSPNDEAKKRNINRLMKGGIVNDEASTSTDTKSGSGSTYKRSNVHRLKDLNDSEDENATWNGNSTQQQ